MTHFLSSSPLVHCLLLLGLAFPVVASETPRLHDDARRALRQGVEFFRREVAVEGTYLWAYSADLSQREGEGVTSAGVGWIQPPGTPSVGMAFLQAYEATGDGFYMDAARETAYGLMRGQLRSGGWYYYVDFDPSSSGRRRLAYRDSDQSGGRNVTTLDDDTTQAALRFLMRTDQALKFQDEPIRESIRIALQSLLKAQYPNGAWPQGYDRFPDPSKYPVIKASYPDSWPRTWPGSRDYWLFYTLNDNVLANMIETMLLASRTYGSDDVEAGWHELAHQCRQAAEKAGEFLLLAQMPEPQPAWAQQYDFQMHPTWARKFEPPAITGGESQRVLRILLELYAATDDPRFLKPIPPALEYLRGSRLPDGRLARFYELRSNRPLYFTSEYELTTDDSDMPTHYGFKVTDGTEGIARELERLQKGDGDHVQEEVRRTSRINGELLAAVKAIVAAQDDRGRWIEQGPLRYHRPKDPSVQVIRTATFIRNVETLSRYLDGVADAESD